MKNLQISGNIMRKNERILEFFKKGKITEKEVIRLLVIANFVLVIFIVGLRYTHYVESQELPTVATEESYEDKTDDKEDDSNRILVDINTDNIFLLCQLPGIGEAKASAILEYRKENGDFENTEDILNVPGIGQSIYENIKELIYIEKAEAETSQ